MKYYEYDTNLQDKASTDIWIENVKKRFSKHGVQHFLQLFECTLLIPQFPEKVKKEVLVC